MMNTSQDITKLAPALVKAQAQTQTAVKKSTNPHFRSKYADLESVWEAMSKALEENKLALIQAPGLVVDGQMHMTSRIIHESGQWIESEASTPVAKLDPQGYGSAVTYMRRYTAAALLGVVSGEDDDGHAASRPEAKPQPKEESPAPVRNGKTASHGFPAKFAGRCHDCGGEIEKGDPVEFVPNTKKVRHANGCDQIPPEAPPMISDRDIPF